MASLPFFGCLAVRPRLSFWRCVIFAVCHSLARSLVRSELGVGLGIVIRPGRAAVVAVSAAAALLLARLDEFDEILDIALS